MPSNFKNKIGWIISAAILALVVGGAFWWNAHKGDYFPKNFGTVEEGKIFRSGQLSPALIQKTLADHNVKRVIALDGNTKPVQKTEVEICREMGIEHLNFPLRGDGTGDVEQYVRAIEAMNDAATQNKPVLVHCSAGAQRTGGVVAIYEMLVRHKSPADVRRDMLRYGWKPADAPLLNYVNAHMAEIAQKLAERKVIERVPDPLPQIPEN